MAKKVLLVITDGIGFNESDYYNAFAKAKTPTYDLLFKNYQNSKIQTSGLSVGLPEGQMGNSEVGHMSIGSGRVIYQNLVKINDRIKDKSLFAMPVFKDIIQKSNAIHIVALFSDGGVHSSLEHIKAVILEASKTNTVYLHIISDGRDVRPQSVKQYIQEVEQLLNENIKIATISGRFYAMDRDNRWDRVRQAYDSIAYGDNNSKFDIYDYIDDMYKQDVYDEFIVPASFDAYGGIQDNDGIIFCNFRSDRMREMAMSFEDGFDSFQEVNKYNIKTNILTMTSYSDEFNFPVWIVKNNIINTLSQVVSDNNLRQFHIAETEKYAHVTFFLNGGVDKAFKGEDRKLISSMDVKTYDEAPEMRAKDIADGIIEAMDSQYDYIVANFANGDMVGHTGNFEASIRAVEVVDDALARLMLAREKYGYDILITSDHGNCEEMKDADGNTLTNHTTKDVFCFCISENYKNIKDGSLSNIAPSILKLMDLDIPKEMDKSILY